MRNWCLCFKPPATIEIDDGVDCSADRMISLIAAARRDNKKKRQPKKISPKTKTKTKTLDSSIPNHTPSSKTLRRSFSSVVKAVVFETSLSRRVREAKLRSRSERFFREPPSDFTIPLEKPVIIVEQKVDSKNNPSESDCSFVTSTENSKPIKVTAENSKPIDVTAETTAMINPVMCLLLISLLVTVFWGRLCAVMTTTVWIYAWQSGAVVVGLGEILKTKNMKLKKNAMKSSETEKVTDNFSATGKQLIIERGLRQN